MRSMHSPRVVLPDSKFASDFDVHGLSKGLGGAILLHGLIFLSFLFFMFPQARNQRVLKEITLIEIEPVVPVPRVPVIPPAVSSPKPRAFPFLKELFRSQPEPLKPKELIVPLRPRVEPNPKHLEPLPLNMTGATPLGETWEPAELIPDVGKRAKSFETGAMPAIPRLEAQGRFEAPVQAGPDGMRLGKRRSGSSFRPAVSGTQPLSMQNARAQLAVKPVPAVPARPRSKEADAVVMFGRDQAFRISGELQDRAILSSTLPAYPRWAEELGFEGTVVIRFSVRPDGTVMENMVVVQSSGHADLDHVALEALGNFRFSPIASSMMQDGRIAFFFRLR